MVTLYSSNTINAGADAVIQALAKSTARRNIIIVPDAFTLSLETGVLAKLKREGTFDIEVMSFARLASVTLGNEIKKCLSPSGSVMLMDKVIHLIQSKLQVYGKSALKQGFASEVYAAITSVRNSGITVDALKAVLSSLPEYVKAKTADIILIYEEYLKELNINHTDSSTRLEALRDSINAESELADANYYIIDYVEFNAMHLQIIAKLMQYAREVHIATCESDGGDNARMYPYKNYKKVYELAKKSGAFTQKNVPNVLAETNYIMANNIFAYAGETRKETDCVTLLNANSIGEELRGIATEITKLVRDDKLRYRDIVIISPDFNTYVPYVERIFADYNIPVFADKRYLLSTQPIFTHVVSAFECAAKKMHRVNVMRYVKHVLFDAVDYDEKMAFEDYVLQYGLNFSRFVSPFAVAKDDVKYEAAEKVRASFMEEIAPICAIKDEATTQEYVNAIFDFWAKSDMDTKIKNYCELAREKGMQAEAEVSRQVPEKLRELLDAMSELYGEEKIKIDVFLSALKAGAEQVKIVSLPVSVDCVYFADIAQAMYTPVPALFVVGAENKTFPLESTKDGILSDREYTAWQAQNIVISDTGVEELTTSRFHALELAIRGERLYLSHVAPSMPSVIAKELVRIFGLKEQKMSELLKSDRYSFGVKVPTQKVAEYYLTDYSRKEIEGSITDDEKAEAVALAKALNRDFPIKYESDIIESVSPNCFYENNEIRTSVSRLQSYLACPFAHFIQYGLRAKEKLIAVSDLRDRGTVIHACLQEFTKDRRNFALSDDDARKAARNIAEDILKGAKYQAVAEYDGAQVLEKLKAECAEVAVIVKNHSNSSEFKPYMTENAFYNVDGNTSGKQLSVVRLADDAYIVGAIDRVDALGKKVVAYDYKTGSTDCSFGDIYYGKKIQLPIYMAVLRENGYTPVGGLYVKISGEYASDKRILFGQVIGEKEIVCGIDNTIDFNKEGKYLALKIAQDKNTNAEKVEKKGCTVSESELDNIINYAVNISKLAVAEMKEGYIKPTPLGDSCKHCKFAGICHAKEQFVRKGGSVDVTAFAPKEDEGE